MPSSRLKLEFLFFYLKENSNQVFYGYVYGISQSIVSEWLSFLLPELDACLESIGYMAKYGLNYEHKDIENKHLTGDIVERNGPRRSWLEAQKVESSGKKKLHTIKHFRLSDQDVYLHFISPSYEGSVHDKTIWDELMVKVAVQNLLMDLGFGGAEDERLDVILPFKKPKGGQLSKVQKQLNTDLSSLRVRVEHAFGAVKRLKIIRNKIRLKGYDKRELVFKIVVGLHNFRTSSRKLIQFNS